MSQPIPPTTYDRTPLVRAHTVMGYQQNAAAFPFRMTPVEERMAARVQQAAQDHSLTAAALPIRSPVRVADRVHLAPHHSTYTGKRAVNEDKHVIISTPYGDIFAICDGHGILDPVKLQEGLPQVGEEIAQIVADSVEKELPKFIQDHHFNTQKAFKAWADHVQTKMPPVIAGTTAVIGFFEKITRYFHVATVGDSEAVVFRMRDEKIHAIPLSTQNNWATPACVERAKEVLEPPVFAKWSERSAKHRRFPPEKGVNLACSFGDTLMLHNGKTAISHEPDCSLLQLEEGDLIMLGCDGIFDFASLQELIDQVIQPSWNNPSINLADRIALFALNKKGSNDNVSAITVRVNSATSNVVVNSSLSTQPLSPHHFGDTPPVGYTDV